MELKFEGFTRTIPDNDLQYFVLLEASITSVDPNSYVYIARTPSTYLFKISPSDPKLINLLISEINSLHKHVNILLNWSKSMKKSSTLSFTIPIFAERN